ncbi:MAG: hypothetical protein M3M85_00200 [bacterium]|nr:hypothetical protein [bacterium]
MIIKTPDQIVPDINAEFERLKALASTEHGFESISDAWHMALNYKRGKDRLWYPVKESKGNKVAGFAFDPKTQEYELTPPGVDHYAALKRLRERLELEGREDENSFEVEHRFLHGSAAYTKLWKFPLIMMYGIIPIDEIEKIDQMVLEKKVGLPISAIFRKKHASR